MTFILIGDRIISSPTTISTTKNEGANMNSDEAEVRKRLREDRINKEVQRRRDLMEHYPESNYPNGSVIKFEKKDRRSNSATKLLIYAAVKANGKWWMTGFVPGSMDHDSFLTWLFDDLSDTPVIQLATAWE